MDHELFGPLQLAEEQIGFLEGGCPEAQLEKHCAAYESAIGAAGGIEIAVLGVGVNGHLAFNEPGAHSATRTRRIRLSETTRLRPGFPGGVDGPSQALTVGLGTILEAKEIEVLAFGVAKKEALSRLHAGVVDMNWPVTRLLQHAKARSHTVVDCPLPKPSGIGSSLRRNASRYSPSPGLSVSNTQQGTTSTRHV